MNKKNVVIACLIYLAMLGAMTIINPLEIFRMEFLHTFLFPIYFVLAFVIYNRGICTNTVDGEWVMWHYGSLITAASAGLGSFAIELPADRSVIIGINVFNEDIGLLTSVLAIALIIAGTINFFMEKDYAHPDTAHNIPILWLMPSLLFLSIQNLDNPARGIMMFGGFTIIYLGIFSVIRAGAEFFWEEEL